MTTRTSTLARRFHRLDANLRPSFTRHLQQFFSDQAARVLHRFLLAIPAERWDHATKVESSTAGRRTPVPASSDRSTVVAGQRGSVSRRDFLKADDFEEIPPAPPTAEEVLPEDEKQRLWLALLPFLLAATTNSADLAGSLVGIAQIAGQDPRIDDLLRDSGTRIAGIHRTTLNAIRTTLADGVSRGYSARQIAYGVPEDDFRGLRDTVKETYKGRALTIATNEIANARAQASAEMFQEAGVQMVYISDGGQCGWASHGSGDRANGTRRTLIEYRQTPFSHINCIRVGIPIMEGR